MESYNATLPDELITWVANTKRLYPVMNDNGKRRVLKQGENMVEDMCKAGYHGSAHYVSDCLTALARM